MKSEIKPISPALEDAPAMRIVPVCLTTHALARLMARYPHVKQVAIARAWAKVQMRFWSQTPDWRHN